MKDLLNVQDYLFAIQDVGDWEGEEEVVAERLNDLIHMAWERLPDDLDCESIDEIINGDEVVKPEKASKPENVKG